MKKIFAFVGAVLVLSGSAFAQTSMTSYSTEGLFGTDVDNYMDVNQWSTVQPKNFFAYLGYGESGTDTYELGGATTYKNMYFAAFMTGRWDSISLSSTTTTVDNTSGTTKRNSFLYGDYTVKVLFGMDKLGVKAGLSRNTTTDTNVVSGTTTTVTKDYDVYPFVEVGYNTFFGLYDITPYAGIQFNIYKNKIRTTDTSASTDTTTDKGSGMFMLYAGTGIDLGKKGMFQQEGSLEVSLNDEYSSSSTSYGENTFYFSVTPSYTVTVSPSKELTIKANASALINNTFYAGVDYTVDTDGNKTYTTSRTTSFSVGVLPSVSVAAQYVIKPNKLVFNTGASFIVPKGGISFSTTKSRDTSGKETGTSSHTSSLYFTTAANDGKFTLSDGFTWTLTPNVTFDVESNLISSVTSGFSTDLHGGIETSILNTLNQIFVHNIAFTVQCKF